MAKNIHSNQINYNIEFIGEYNEDDSKNICTILLCNYLKRLMGEGIVLCKAKDRIEESKQILSMLKFFDTMAPTTKYFSDGKLNLVKLSKNPPSLVAMIVYENFASKINDELRSSIINENEKFFIDNFDSLIKGTPSILKLEFLKKYIEDESITKEEKVVFWNIFKQIIDILK